MYKIILTGNVGRDAEARADQAGNSFTTFSVAVSVGSKANPKTDWVDISCSGKLAEIAALYVKKGMKILCEGFPTINSYQAKDGAYKATQRVFANNLEFLSKQDDEPQAASDNTVYQPLPANSSTLKGDDIPF